MLTCTSNAKICIHFLRSFALQSVKTTPLPITNKLVCSSTFNFLQSLKKHLTRTKQLSVGPVRNSTQCRLCSSFTKIKKVMAVTKMI